MILLDYPVDACPSCPPGFPDPCLPVGEPRQASGGAEADYEHEACGTAWTAWFDAYGWVIDRAVAPVSPGQERERHAA